MTGPHPHLVATLRAAGCVFAEEEAVLLAAAASGADQDALVARRVAGEPLEYVVGWALFDGHRVVVRPGIFVPRRRTETLVAEADRTAPSRHELTVVDLCCGSGALGLALMCRLLARGREVELHAADLLPEAVACARDNVGDLGAVHHGDLFDALPDRLRGRVDVLLANVPYVPTDEIVLLPGEARDHEPRATLDGGADGLDLARRVVDGAVDWLAPGGSVQIETSARQAPALAAYVETAGLAVGRRGEVVRGVRGGTPPGRRVACRR